MKHKKKLSKSEQQITNVLTYHEKELQAISLRGKEFFPGQSLNNPLPFAERDIRKCIENEIDILKKRGAMF